MADQHQVTRTVTYFDGEGHELPGPVDPLLAFYWARLDEQADSPDVHAKRAILDDYARHCADLDNPARKVICEVTRTVIKHLATVYADHPDYTEDFRP
ncbi:DUF6221 family protein [Amycolatopsis sp. NPDC051128]|uniref:DUF6221 family protein n=1 Tax=Amycolatopsis sp. NPDC051128 TaxID=3155412 RepID=UPI00342D908E